MNENEPNVKMPPPCDLSGVYEVKEYEDGSRYVLNRVPCFGDSLPDGVNPFIGYCYVQKNNPFTGQPQTMKLDVFFPEDVDSLEKAFTRFDECFAASMAEFEEQERKFIEEQRNQIITPNQGGLDILK